MNIIINISIISSILTALLIFEDCLKLYQETHYNLKVYISKIIKYYKKYFLYLFIYFPFSNLWYVSLINITVSLLVLIKYVNKKTIKHLKFTTRILRQCIVIGALIFSIKYIYKDLTNILTLTNFIAYLLVFVSGIILLPIESLIRQYYRNKSKSKIKKFNPFVIGITGSCGKTSIKNYLYAILNSKYNCYITPKSYNTINGISLTINNLLKHEDALFILEMGASKKNDIKQIVNYIKPNIAIVSEITNQHINTFKNIETILEEKMKIIENMDSDGVGYINYDNKYIQNYVFKNVHKIVKCGTSRDCDCYAYNIKHTLKGLEFSIKYRNIEFDISTKLVGIHNVNNLCISIAIAIDMGITIDTLKSILEEISNHEHRLEIKETKSLTIIDDSYNSNPIGFLNALDVLDLAENKRILITPGIVDCGKMEYEINYGLAKKISEVCDEVILVSNQSSQHIKKGLDDLGYTKYKIVTNFKEAISLVNEGTLLIENDLTDGYFI